MNAQEIREVAWLADEYLTGPVRGVVLSFHGLGCPGVRKEPSMEEWTWAAAGGLVVFPYYGPWSWMNRQARAMVDDLVDAVYETFGLDDSVPLIATGGSMGGYSALLYTRYARRPVKACLAIYPACDLAFHFHERPDLPRTIRHAFLGYPEDLDALLAEHSPLAQTPHMPDIPYLFVQGDQDRMVDKTRHSDPMVAALRAAGRNVDYIEVPGLGHTMAMPIEILQRAVDFVRGHLGN